MIIVIVGGQRVCLRTLGTEVANLSLSPCLRNHLSWPFVNQFKIVKCFAGNDGRRPGRILFVTELKRRERERKRKSFVSLRLPCSFSFVGSHVIFQTYIKDLLYSGGRKWRKNGPWSSTAPTSGEIEMTLAKLASLLDSLACLSSFQRVVQHSSMDSRLRSSDH